MRKKEGTIEMFSAMMLILLISSLLILNIRMKEIKNTKVFIEDGLVASNLASAIIDLEEYGTTNIIINREFDKTYTEFREALKHNLKLNNNYEATNKLIKGKVNIEEYTIYNVVGNDIQYTSIYSSGVKRTSVITNGLGTTKTPNGALISSTTMYAKISFKIRGYLDTEYQVYKENSVDITDKE